MPRSKSNSEYTFVTRLATIKGALVNTVVFLPEEIVEALPKGRVRAKGTMNGAPFALAPQYKKEGGRYFAVSASLRKAAGVKDGGRVEVKFKLVDPAIVDMPEELEAVLAQDDQAQAVWKKLTTGYQRSLIHYITSVRNVDSRIKRSLELMEKVKVGKLHVQATQVREKGVGKKKD